MDFLLLGKWGKQANKTREIKELRNIYQDIRIEFQKYISRKNPTKKKEIVEAEGSIQF